MDIQRNNFHNKKNAQLEDFYFQSEKETEAPPHSSEELARKAPAGALLHWRAPEYEVYERDKKWFLYMSLVWVALIAYAVWTNSPIMAITFILIGIIEYIHVGQEPKLLDFAITADGVIAGNELYHFDNLHSFWIFYEPPYQKELSLHTKGKLAPFIHIPLENEDPTQIREILLKNIPEIKQEQRLVNTLERILRL